MLSVALRPQCRHIAAALVLALAPVGCRPSAGPRVLRIAHEADVASLDPIAATDSISKSILANIYDSLVEWDGRFIPGLALAWNSPDDHTWMFTLRRGVRTHAGGLLTAGDVKWSIDRARNDPASRLGDRLATIESVEVVNESTLRVRTRLPDPFLMHRLTDILIAPKSAARYLETRPLGTGPFQFVRRSPGEIEVAAFALHWRGAPAWDRVRFLVVKPGPETVAALRDARVDVLRWVPEDLVGRIKTLPGVRVVERPSSRGVYLWMNSQQSPGSGNPLSDRRVRRAIALAVDRNVLIGRLGGRATPLLEFVPPGIFGSVARQLLPSNDLAAARALLRDAGRAEGFDESLTFAHGADELASDLAKMLGQIGIRVKLDRREWPAMLADWRKARLPLFLGSWTFTNGDASLFLKECIYSRDPRLPSGWNPGFSSARIDDLIAENLRTFNETIRFEQYRELSTELAEEMPVVPLLTRFDIYAVRVPLEWQPRNDGSLLAAEIAPANR